MNGNVCTRALIALSFVFSVVFAGAEEPGEQYIHISGLIEEADALKPLQPEQAVVKYREARAALIKLQKEYPGWNTSLVNYRLDFLALKIEPSAEIPAAPVAEPVSGPSGLFPKMPPAPMVYVVDCRKESRAARMTAWALQGMINQTAAEVYLINNPYEIEALKYSRKPFENLDKLSGDNGGLRTLFQKYQGRVKKMVVYDPERNWTWYLALMAAAQGNGIPVTESLRNELSNEFGWKGESEDFRERWSNRSDAYDWALANLMPRCSKKVVFALRMDKRLTDYAAASRGFIFWLDFKNEQEQIARIFKTKGYRVGTSLMGYGSNADSANETANRYGIGYVVSDFYSNGSFWSSFPNKTYKQAPGRAVAAQPGKIYASIMWSDGDNISFDQNPLYLFWKSSARGKVPVATQMSPTLQELNPPLLDWYYEKMTARDELVCGPTGVQFIFIRDFKESFFPEWCQLTRSWCAGAGLHSARIWIAPNPSAKFTTYMKTCGFDGVFGEGWFLHPGFPPKIETYGAPNEEALLKRFTRLQPDPRAPLFVSFTAIVQGFDKPNGGYAAINRQVERLEGEYPGRYVFLLPKDQFATIRAYYKNRN